MKRLLVLALATCILLPAVSTLALTSPLNSPIPPPDPLRLCPRDAIVMEFGLDHAVCKWKVVEELGLDIHWEYVQGCVTGAYTGPACDGMLRWDFVTPTAQATVAPEPTPTPTATPAVEWLRDDLWMGRCRMWTDGQRVTRVECP